METHAAQDVKMVLMHAGQYPLADGGECAFVVGQKDSLNELGCMNLASTTGGWDACGRRSWCNGVFKNAIPTTLLPIFRQMKVITANGSGTTTVDSIDTFALPAEKEVFGNNTEGNATAEASLFQLDWYKTDINRQKKVNGGIYGYWSRTTSRINSMSFCYISALGDRDWNEASFEYGISPQGCIGKKVSA